MGTISKLVLALVVSAGLFTTAGVGQAKVHTMRRVVEKVAPVYPAVARRNGIRGTVKLVVAVRANGSVKSAKVLGGHPMLIEAAVNVVRNWKFEPAREETAEVIELVFDPSN